LSSQEPYSREGHLTGHNAVSPTIKCPAEGNVKYQAAFYGAAFFYERFPGNVQKDARQTGPDDPGFNIS
jgi:hypothetical protein